MRVDVKPLSVNECWKGRRFKTDKYDNYEFLLLHTLPKFKVPEGKLEIYFKWGFSSRASDWDNPIKAFQDVLQKKYKFNDKDVWRAIVEKEIVPKGKEYIEFEIKALE